MKGIIMTYTTTIKTLREDHHEALIRRNVFVLELQKKHGIPNEEISKFWILDDEHVDTGERYMEALFVPWWKLVWRKLTTLKK